MGSASSTADDGTTTRASSRTETRTSWSTATGINSDKLFQSSHRISRPGCCSRPAGVTDRSAIPTRTADASAIGAIAVTEAAADGQTATVTAFTATTTATARRAARTAVSVSAE